MAYTSHGHYIDGSPVGGLRPLVARCNGVLSCPTCIYDVSRYRKNVVKLFTFKVNGEVHAKYISMKGIVDLLARWDANGDNADGFGHYEILPVEVPEPVNHIADYFD